MLTRLHSTCEIKVFVFTVRACAPNLKLIGVRTPFLVKQSSVHNQLRLTLEPYTASFRLPISTLFVGDNLVTFRPIIRTRGYTFPKWWHSTVVIACPSRHLGSNELCFSRVFQCSFKQLNLQHLL